MAPASTRRLLLCPLTCPPPPQNFWTRVAGRWGVKFYWQDNGPSASILNAVTGARLERRCCTALWPARLGPLPVHHRLLSAQHASSPSLLPAQPNVLQPSTTACASRWGAPSAARCAARRTRRCAVPAARVRPFAPSGDPHTHLSLPNPPSFPLSAPLTILCASAAAAQWLFIGFSHRTAKSRGGGTCARRPAAGRE